MREFLWENMKDYIRSDIKDKIMDRFVSGDTKLLVATTVIEVGVNVPSANIMVVENAEKFGLAQLHQLHSYNPFVPEDVPEAPLF